MLSVIHSVDETAQHLTHVIKTALAVNDIATGYE